jgi:hypothetical protein
MPTTEKVNRAWRCQPRKTTGLNYFHEIILSWGCPTEAQVNLPQKPAPQTGKQRANQGL